MTTTPTKVDPLAGIACPSWCTRAPGHPSDSTDHHRGDPRGHGGPSFGKHLSAGATEYADAPGHLAYSVHLHAEYAEITKPSELLDLATQAIAAAQWLEANRGAAGSASAACRSIPMRPARASPTTATPISASVRRWAGARTSVGSWSDWTSTAAGRGRLPVPRAVPRERRLGPMSR